MASALPADRQGETLSILLRLERSLTTPALLLTWSLGLLLAISTDRFAAPWLLAKLVLVAALSAYHGIQSGRLRRSLRAERTARPVPAAAPGIVLATFAIAALVLAKPF